MHKNQSTPALQEFLAISKRVGDASPQWCQGDSGFVSVKFEQGPGRQLIIKRPSVRMSEVCAESGWKQFAVDTLLNDLDRPIASEWLDCHHASIHALLPSSIVVEITSLVALLMAHEHGQDMNVPCWLSERLRADVAIIPYPRSLHDLLGSICANIEKSAIIIANYGVLLQSDTADIVERWEAVEREFCERIGYLQLLKHISGSGIADVMAAPAPKRNYVGGPRRQKHVPSDALVEAALAPRAGRRSPERQYRLESDDPCVNELWQAHQILFAECPNLAELPQTAAGAFIHKSTRLSEDDLLFRRR